MKKFEWIMMHILPGWISMFEKVGLIRCYRAGSSVGIAHRYY